MIRRAKDIDEHTPWQEMTPAGEVYEALRYKHEMTLTPNGGELGKKLLRVGHIGYHPHEDQEQLVLALKDVLNGGI